MLCSQLLEAVYQSEDWFSIWQLKLNTVQSIQMFLIREVITSYECLYLRYADVYAFT